MINDDFSRKKKHVAYYTIKEFETYASYKIKLA